MKPLEIIKLLIEEKSKIKLDELLRTHYIYNLIEFCCLNKKYLTDENLDIILFKENDLTKHFNYINPFKDPLDNYYSSLTKLISKYPEVFDKLSYTTKK